MPPDRLPSMADFWLSIQGLADDCGLSAWLAGQMCSLFKSYYTQLSIIHIRRT